MCYLFSPSLLNYFLLIVSYLTLAGVAIRGGVFMDFFMWSTYLFLIASLRFGLSLKVRSLFIVLTIPLLVLIQSAKEEYRQVTWKGKSEASISLLTDIAIKKNESNNVPFTKSEGVVRTVGRLNQGWHLGKVLKWVPKHEAFANGADFWGDIKGTILPRIFFSDKKIIGGQDK